jgi:PilZ domain
MANEFEQRWSERRPVILEVTLSVTGQRPQSVTCRDLGIGGMYVEAGSAPLALNGQIQVGFTLKHAKSQSHHRLRAQVVWVSAQGAGLVFSDLEPETVRALREVIYDEEENTASSDD